MKRLVDVALSTVSLVVLLPVAIIAAIAVVIDSGSPVLFRQTRIGRGFIPFDIIKFRTMSVGGDEAVMAAERAGDVTAVGRWLRRTKIDEIPQLLNVIVADMSLVGPRPEIPDVVAAFRDEYSEILRIRPGITSPASIEFHDEENVLASYDDPAVAYVEVVVPQKVALDKRYVSHRSLVGDMRILADTVRLIWSRN